MTKTFKDYLKEAETSESGLQYYTGVKKHGKEYMKKAAKAGREGASQEELGRLKDKYSKAEKTKEAYSPGDENEEGMVSNCCGAPIMDVYQGHGRCSDCKEMASAVPDNEELDRMKELAGASIDETYDDDDAFYEAYGEMWWNDDDDPIDEAEYQGRKVKLGKPMQGDVKKFKVYVKDPKTGNIKKVNFGHGGSSVKGKAMSIKKNNPKRRKSFRARHNCDNPGPRTKARYWSCRKW